jgi:purine-binding chemotaxis protein CheW
MSNFEIGFSSKTSDAWICFMVKEDRFAFCIEDVREILTYEESTRVPLMPLFLKGIFNLRGQVIPLVDLGLRFWGDPLDVKKRTGIAILDITYNEEKHPLGVMIDSFLDVIQLSPDDIQHPATLGIGIRKEFLRGVTEINGEMIMLLETDKVLSVEELASLVENMDEIQDSTPV